jgi:broad specificity phosphatase PhoE
VSEVVRLTLVSHAMTDAMSAGRFPADEPLSDLGRRQGDSAIRGTFDRAHCAPELRTRQTASLLGLDAAAEPLLADLDCGNWRGRALNAMDPAELAVWLTDPESSPHGGETVMDLIARVRVWLDTLIAEPACVAAVTHPAVVRAAILIALDAPPKSFWRIDIAPLSQAVLHGRAGRWTLRVG